MTQLAHLNMPTHQYKYPQVSLDSSYGQVVPIKLNTVNLVKEYLFTIVEGSLTGGTSPAWTVSGSNPLVTHVTIKADNQTIYDADYSTVAEELKLFNGFSSNGLSLWIKMGLQDILNQGKLFEQTVFPSFKFNQVYLYLTVAPLANVTSGSPTGSSGTTLYLTEIDIDRSQVNFPILKTVKLQFSASQPITGENHNTSLLSLDGLYAYMQVFGQADTDISYLKLVINTSHIEFDSYFSALKAENSSVFKSTPDNGYAYLLFSEDGSIDKMLALDNPSALKSVDLIVDTTTSPLTTTFFKTEIIGYY
ncbi:MAG: hypothetical protein QXU98_09575 [Candidatus Parvarchaeota archaeon]